MKKLFMAALVASTCSFAYASDLPGTPYIGGSLGSTQYFQKLEGPNPNEYYSASNSGLGANVALFGGWTWQNSQQYFAGAELRGRFTGYTYALDEGQEDEFDFETRNTSIGAFVHGGKWLNQKWSLYGLVGVNYNAVEFEDKTEKDSGVDNKYMSIEAGIGSDFRFARNWSLRSEITYDYGLDNAFDNDYVKITRSGLNFDIGIKYSF